MTAGHDPGAAPALVDRLRPEHAGEALTVQYAAYLSEARRYGTTEIPPLVETVAELSADLARDGVVGVGAWIGPRLVGCVRLRPAAEGGRELARYCVAPDVLGRGVGRALMTAALAAAGPDTRLWLITGSRSGRNVRLYEAAGFLVAGTLVDAAGVELLRMERPAPPGPAEPSSAESSTG